METEQTMFNSQQKLSFVNGGGDKGGVDTFTTTTTTTTTTSSSTSTTSFANGHIANGSLSHGNGFLSNEEKSSNLDSSNSSPTTTSSNESVMSINRLCNDPIEPIESSKEMVAAEVLQNLSRGGTDNQAPVESSTVSTSQTTSNGIAHRIQSNKFIRKTIDMYESGKNSHQLLKYSADAIESSIKTITRPIVGALPEQLDEYACRGWDKLEERFPGVMDTTTSSTSTKQQNGSEDMNPVDIQDQESRRRRSEGQASHRRPHRSSNASNFAPYPTNNNSVSATASAPRSRLHQMLVETGTVFGGVGAAVSEESMKSLKYCLQWLHYANQQIEHQIALLRDFIVKLTGPSSSALIHTSASSTLGSIKRDVVDTLRKVIEVVSKYAGACLPEQARQNVKEFILTLPTRWASINRTDHSATPSPLSSPQMNPSNPHTQTTDYARRLLSLATESGEMLKGVASIFGETIEKAELWVVRLKRVGVMSSATGSNTDLEFESIPQFNGYNVNTNRRRQSGPKRPNGSVHRKPSRTMYREDDDPSINDNYDDYSTSESEAENKRMEMDLPYHSIKTSSMRSNNLSSLSAKKRPKKAKKEEDEKMDLS